MPRVSNSPMPRNFSQSSPKLIGVNAVSALYSASESPEMWKVTRSVCSPFCHSC